jgi:hypothetical protein
MLVRSIKRPRGLGPAAGESHSLNGSTGQNSSLRLLQGGNSNVPGDGREIVKEPFQRMTSLDVINKLRKDSSSRSTLQAAQATYPMYRQAIAK